MPGTSKKKSGPPTGPEHTPDAVRAHKARMFRIRMAELAPSLVGSAAYRRARKATR